MSLPPIARPVPDASGGAAAARAEDAAFPPGQPFEELLSGLKDAKREAGAFLGDQAREDGEAFRAPAAARMFNEHGFFHGAVGANVAPAEVQGANAASTAEPAIALEPSASVPVRAAAAPHQGVPPGADEKMASLLPEIEVTAKAPATGEPATSRLQFGEATSPTVAQSAYAERASAMASRTVAQPAAARALPAALRAAAVLSRQASAPAREAEAASSATPKRIAALIEALLNQANATGVRVDVRVAQEGLKIVARTEKLDRAERGRLLADIAALVSRHGRGDARISLNGESAPDHRPWRA